MEKKWSTTSGDRMFTNFFSLTGEKVFPPGRTAAQVVIDLCQGADGRTGGSVVVFCQCDGRADTLI